jgi:hypothetical protein
MSGVLSHVRVHYSRLARPPRIRSSPGPRIHIRSQPLIRRVTCVAKPPACPHVNHPVARIALCVRVPRCAGPVELSGRESRCPTVLSWRVPRRSATARASDGVHAARSVGYMCKTGLDGARRLTLTPTAIRKTGVLVRSPERSKRSSHRLLLSAVRWPRGRRVLMRMTVSGRYVWRVHRRERSDAPRRGSSLGRCRVRRRRGCGAQSNAS